MAPAPVEAFVEALGPEAVLMSDADLREFRDPYSLAGSDHPAPAACVPP